jgi:hypothetical protein
MAERKGLTVKQVIKELQKMDPDLPLYLADGHDNALEIYCLSVCLFQLKEKL